MRQLGTPVAPTSCARHRVTPTKGRHSGPSCSPANWRATGVSRYDCSGSIQSAAGLNRSDPDFNLQLPHLRPATVHPLYLKLPDVEKQTVSDKNVVRKVITGVMVSYPTFSTSY